MLKNRSLCLGMQKISKTIDTHHVDLALRIGSIRTSGGGVLEKEITYDLWGNTVNIAARIEANGPIDEIHISETTHSLIEESFVCEARGSIELKGIGTMNTWLLKGPKNN